MPPLPMDPDTRVVIIGAGPAGLTAAYQLEKSGVDYVVLEKDNVVGGISRTAEHDGYLFDIGGHRFFTKVKVVEELWHEILPSEDFLLRGRISRIYYDKKFFHYPLRAFNALFGLGPWNSFLILMSYVKAKILPVKPENTLEQWVSNRFGRRLYEIFFKSYTEKVWGIPCNEISAEWAAQRIKGLSLMTALKNALLGSQAQAKGEVIKTLIDAFHYPRRGPGMMWERVADIVRASGKEVRLNTGVERIFWSAGRVDAVEVATGDRRDVVAGTHFISTMPIQELVCKLDPPAPPDVLAAADGLNYRDFLTVAVVVDKAQLFPDNWIYIHEPDVLVGRIQNFKNWSPDMVPDQSKTCLGLEYFCFEGDGLWTTPDDELVRLARRELAMLGLAREEDVESGAVVRMPKAYPVYDGVYEQHLSVIRAFLAGLPNIQLVGRNGMHKYNNQDHSMLTAMLAVENILGAEYDLWQVNAEQEYHEEVRQADTSREAELALLASTQPRVPGRVQSDSES